jgi:hypothetical protein
MSKEGRSLNHNEWTLVDRLLALIEGVEGTYTCMCSRRLRVGNSLELMTVVAALRRLQADEEIDASAPNTSRFALLEID